MRFANGKKTPSRAMAYGMRAPVRTTTWSAPRTQVADLGRGFDRMRLSPKHACNHNHHYRADLQERQQHLDRSSQAHAQEIDGGDGHHHERRERLGCGEGETVSPDMARKQGSGHNPEHESQKTHKPGNPRKHP